MAREYLPRSALARAAGDGLLRLQARASYKCHLMQHPLHDWMPAIFPLAGAFLFSTTSGYRIWLRSAARLREHLSGRCLSCPAFVRDLQQVYAQWGLALGHGLQLLGRNVQHLCYAITEQGVQCCSER